MLLRANIVVDLLSGPSFAATNDILAEIPPRADGPRWRTGYVK
jgi:hypothetical protein